MSPRKRVPQVTRIINVMLLALVVLSQSALKPATQTDRIRAFTRMVEFDYVTWTVDALILKNVQEAVNAPRYMSVRDQRKVVYEYIGLVQAVNQTTAEIDQIYANPDIENPEQAADRLNILLRAFKDREERLQPIAESVIQYQVSTVLTDMGLSFAGQPIPPVLYHSTHLPNALIVSPREEIRQDANISVLPDMTVDEMEHLEEAIMQELDVSALVVPVGGVGVYPTMVLSTTNLNYLFEVVSHEWIHNYLTLRPLGIQYMASGEMRTINETTANIAGEEIGLAVIERYYPELTPKPQGREETATPAPAPAEPVEDSGIFRFSREMNKTRVRVDELLAEGKIAEAEEYMETRRHFFWANGYQIRKLNQAYFAFHGAYADSPGGGAAGQDPVGPAVQRLRAASGSLTDFLRRIAWVDSFDELLQEVQKAEERTPAADG